MSNKKTIFVCAFASLLALFTACKLIQPKPEPSSEKASVVRVLINADNLPKRTVRPEVALNDVNSWELWGKNNQNTETNLATFTSTTDTTFDLEPGAWNFPLNGYKDDALILSGSLSQTISLDITNTLAFEVDTVKLPGQTGNVSFPVELPNNHGIDYAQVYQDGSSEGDPITPIENNKVVFTKDYEPGEYFISIRLYNAANDLYEVVPEVVYVAVQPHKRENLFAGHRGLKPHLSHHLQAKRRDRDVLRG
jgi:hypothetical protein